ncbi:MAG: tripartite tricarboxylate transporter TctB family protein, partial [Beijerinckiaceae bacterium]
AVLLFESSRLPLFEQYAGLGAGFMPLAVGLGLLAVAIGLAVQVWRGARFEPEAAEGADADQPVSGARLGMAALAVGSPIVTFPLLGFPFGAALAFALVARAFGSRNSLLDIVIGIALSSIAWFAFSKLGVQLGPFLPFGVK